MTSRVEQALSAAQNDRHNAFTRILVDEARRDAATSKTGRLAGVPFAVKDLFDIAGLPTTAGARMRLDATPAKADATVITRLKAEGAVLIGTTNMDEYAYGFATVNAHFGTTLNPHAPDRLAGGSSGGSAAAVAAGVVPLALGSDTNGSIRVPASLCGVWGMRPAMDDMPLEGVFPFVHALDTVGPFTRSLADLKLAYEVMSCRVLATTSATPRIARLTGFFARNADPDALAAVATIDAEPLDLPMAEAARSAAFLITGAQGGALHLDTLKTRAMDYDPAVRDRLIAGAMLPSATYLRAQDMAARWRAQVTEAFQTCDILIAPSTPVTAPRIDAGTIEINGQTVSARANLGILAQPLSLAGIPVISAPVRKSGLPFGLQFATAPGREALLFDYLARLEAEGVLGASVLEAA
ncbi:biuret hydrolase [Asticcacaulis biprosthecium C19]|uniref:Biuret hydrolase n=1 Tax=Asticcacaulis biprosthecium C19 TaxID=715226 RepID=F4QN32_9CAUL|nr:AtzE family amidohydrolase [Asticcacaulis biprosthecium]EGF91623.1 biuret hydrolase [Asticcacaulis biprosthecium C19]